VDDGGNLYFPALLSHEKLEMLRKNQGSRIFNAQYMNDPFPSDEEANFKTQWFRYETKIPEEVRLTLFIDPSIGATEDHDYFACVVAGLDSKNNLHVADYLYGHWKPYEGIAKAFLLINKHPKIREVAIETIAFQKVLKFHIEAEMRRTNKFLQVTEIKHHAKSKIDRIIGLSPRYEQGAVYHQEWMKNGELEDELLKFPRGRRRDLADALSFSSAVLRPRIERKPGMLVAPINSTDDLIHRHLQNRMKSAKIGTVHPYLGTQW
jgi:predicted phage terminase large subunit-like protein